MSRHIHIKPGIVINVIISSYSASYRSRKPISTKPSAHAEALRTPIIVRLRKAKN